MISRLEEIEPEVELSSPTPRLKRRAPEVVAKPWPGYPADPVEAPAFDLAEIETPLLAVKKRTSPERESGGNSLKSFLLLHPSSLHGNSYACLNSLVLLNQRILRRKQPPNLETLLRRSQPPRTGKVAQS
jgi:hypothetical protein